MWNQVTVLFVRSQQILIATWHLANLTGSLCERFRNSLKKRKDQAMPSSEQRYKNVFFLSLTVTLITICILFSTIGKLAFYLVLQPRSMSILPYKLNTETICILEILKGLYKKTQLEGSITHPDQAYTLNWWAYWYSGSTGLFCFICVLVPGNVKLSPVFNGTWIGNIQKGQM